MIGNGHVISFLDDISRPECFFDREPVLPRSSTLGFYVSLGLSPQPKRWAKHAYPMDIAGTVILYQADIQKI